MDFSQLPKMSKSEEPATTADEVATTTPASQHATPAPRPFEYEHSASSGLGSTWISLISGIIFLAMSQTFARWLIARASGKAFETGVTWTDPARAGQPVSYFELMGGTAWTDTGIFLMGVALLFDAALMLMAYRGGMPRRPLLMAAVALTAVAMLINIGVVLYLFGLGILPLMSLIAIAVGGMVLFDHAPLLRRRV